MTYLRTFVDEEMAGREEIREVFDDHIREMLKEEKGEEVQVTFSI